jgi:hypothetical protein
VSKARRSSQRTYFDSLQEMNDGKGWCATTRAFMQTIVSSIELRKHKIFIVATNDRDLKRRVRKVPGVPMVSVARGKYIIERLPDAPEK